MLDDLASILAGQWRHTNDRTSSIHDRSSTVAGRSRRARVDSTP